MTTPPIVRFIIQWWCDSIRDKVAHDVLAAFEARLGEVVEMEYLALEGSWEGDCFSLRNVSVPVHVLARAFRGVYGVKLVTLMDALPKDTIMMIYADCVLVNGTQVYPFNN